MHQLYGKPVLVVDQGEEDEVIAFVKEEIKGMKIKVREGEAERMVRYAR